MCNPDVSCISEPTIILARMNKSSRTWTISTHGAAFLLSGVLSSAVRLTVGNVASFIT